jgi:hypothetical protein
MRGGHHKEGRLDRSTGDLDRMKQTKPNGIEKRTVAKKAAFLRAFRDTGSITRSALLAGIERRTHYEWLAQDAKYKSRFHIVTQMAAGDIRDELVRRGLIGVFKPLIYKGQFQYARRWRMEPRSLKTSLPKTPVSSGAGGSRLGARCSACTSAMSVLSGQLG